MSAPAMAPSPFDGDGAHSDGAHGGGVHGGSLQGGGTPDDGVRSNGRTPDTAREHAVLSSLPDRYRRVLARQEITRDSLVQRGSRGDDPQLSAAAQALWDAERAHGRSLAAKLRALAALHAMEGEYEELTEVAEVDTLRAALALRVTHGAAEWQLRDGYQAVHLFSRTLALLENGRMPAAWFQKMLVTSRKLSDASRRELDIAISTWSMHISAERFFQLLKGLIAHLEHREAQTEPAAPPERSVTLLPCERPGTAMLQVEGPIHEVLGAWKELDESARAVQAAQRAALRDGTEIPLDPDRTVEEERRALSLPVLRFLLLTGADLRTEGIPVPTERFRLNITVPMLTLLGGSDEPGSIDGQAPLPPTLARTLAGGQDTWYRVLTDPSSGAFLPLPADRYRPTTAMLEHLRLRNSLCAAPGCTRPTSWASECDHIEECHRGTPGYGGLTEVENLHLLCWQHHLDKTNGLLDPVRLPTRSRRAPGCTHWSIGADGDAITVIDDLDTASLRMVETLEAAWAEHLRGKHAAEVVQEPPGTAPPPSATPLARSEARAAIPPPRQPRSPAPRQPRSTASRQPRSTPPPAPPAPPPGGWGDVGPPPF
ncbi:HNH endonuclease signature motif containing protein [Brachybacterium sp. Marseille-Q7125]|uniref:HNH endonuclease signature motif containing protein n=1 Tax=Brachybacterium sp. Marseille-Q7125 TaxID=2932815 RepID=UPI001FF5883B|nr:HNH endonuclease signature motif containing protein [Brachybacterium sp. Marseille-Q7125]